MKERLRNLRVESGLTQKELAIQIGSTDKSIWNYEKGLATPPYEILIAYSKYFDVSTDYLLGLEDDFGARPPAPTHNTSALPSDEQELLRVYRSLDSDTQATLWSLLNTWKPVTSLKTKNKS